VIEFAPHGLRTAGNWKVDWKVLPCWCGARPVRVEALRGGAVHLRVELLRAVDGRLEGVVTTESGRQQRFSGTLELLRILEELEPPAEPSLGQVPPR
jgi:hypothetical protein